jgi:hypothetical protein
MEDSNANQATSSLPISNRQSPTARRSGGPRTAEGKRRSCRNARRHGLYTDERFFEGAAIELGDDPRQFQRLLKSLIEARQPVGGLEMALVEGIALLLCKQARLDRSELAVQVSNLHHHDLERRKLSIQVGTGNSDAVELEVRENGLRRFLDSPGKFEQVLGLLTSLVAMIDKNEFGYQMREALIALYGSDFTLRGVKLDEFRYALAKMPPGEAFEKAKNDMTAWVAEEIADVGREYELFLHEHVENTRAARMAATAPSQAQWAIIIRQQNSLARQLERKIRLLMELQRERKSEAQLLESLEASSPPDPSDPQDGATRVPSCCCRTRTPAAVNPSTTGMAQTSFCEVCDVPKGQAGTGDSIQPFPAEHGGVLHEERAITPIAGGTAVLLIFLGAVLAAAFKKTKNRGNELKDLLQRQGITEIVLSKRTHFRAEKAAIGAERSGISRIVRLAVPWLKRSCAIRGRASPTPRVATFQMLYRSHHGALSGQRLPATVLTSGTSV